jgi:hypothetical protein
VDFNGYRLVVSARVIACECACARVLACVCAHECVSVCSCASGSIEAVRVPYRLSVFLGDCQGSIETVRVPIQTVRVP